MLLGATLVTLAATPCVATKLPSLPRGEQLDALIARVARAERRETWDAVTRTWNATPEVRTLASCTLNGLVSDAQWWPALQASGVVRTRTRWPRGEPYRVSLCTLLPAWPLLHVELVPRPSGWHTAEYGDVIWGCCSDGLPRDFELGRLPDYDVHELVFDALLEQGWGCMSPVGARIPPQPQPPIWRGVLRVPVEIVETIDDAIPPVSTPALDAAVRGALAARVDVEWKDEKKRHVVRLELVPDLELHPELRRIGLSLRVDVLREEEKLESPPLEPWSDDERALDIYMALGSVLGRCDLSSIPVDSFSNESEWRRYHLRVSGTSDGVLHLWNAETRWSGTVDVPLSEAIAVGNAREADAARRRKAKMQR